MRIICCNSHKGPYTSREAIVQCSKCEGCWHEGCLRISARQNCCRGAKISTVAANYVEFEMNNVLRAKIQEGVEGTRGESAPSRRPSFGYNGPHPNAPKSGGGGDVFSAVNNIGRAIGFGPFF